MQFTQEYRLDLNFVLMVEFFFEMYVTTGSSDGLH